MRIATLILVFSSTISAQSTPAFDVPTLVTFVAPAYPHAAKESRIQGTVVSEITIGEDGHVLAAKFVSGFHLFVPSVLASLKQWIFRPLQKQTTLRITAKFDLSVDECDGETHVSSELPTLVRIATSAPCTEIDTTSDRKK